MHLLTIIDRLTRWVESAVPLRNVDKSTCTDAFKAELVAHFKGYAECTGSLLVADLHHFIKKPDPYPDPHQSEKS